MNERERETAVDRPTAPAPPCPEDLARSAQTGCSEDFGLLVALFEGPIYQFLLMRTGSPEDAAELTQETFLRAWQKIGYYDSKWKFSTWLFTLARRLAVSHFRSTRRVRDLALVEDIATEDDPSGDLRDQERKSRIWALVRRVLKPDQRTLLWLRYAEDLTIEEISRVVRKPRSSVRVTLFRAREKLARYMTPRGDAVRVRSIDPSGSGIFPRGLLGGG